MQIVFLGTSGMIPTVERNHSSIFLSYKNEGILFDCGEGTQRQLKFAKIPAGKITKILISHWHGDHVLGLPGLLQTLGASEYDKTLKIFGPKGTKKHIKSMFEAFVFDRPFEIEINEIEEGEFYNSKDFRLICAPLSHKIPTIGFAFIENDKRKIKMDLIKKFNIPNGPLIGKLQDGESIKIKNKEIHPNDVSTIVKGKKIAIITDTNETKNCYSLAKDSDLLICESTYDSDLEDKAKEYFHLTAKQSAKIASISNAKKLVLTHFSARYKDTSNLMKTAQEIFPNVSCAYDFMKISL